MSLKRIDKSKLDNLIEYPMIQKSAFRITRNGKWGIMDDTGYVLMAEKFKSLGNFFFDGMLQFEIEQDETKLNSKFGFLDVNFSEVIPPIFSRVQDFEEGFARVALKGSKYGYIDKKGNWLVKPFFDDPPKWFRDEPYYFGSNFSEGLCAVYNRTKWNKKWGYIDTNGKVVIDPIFRDAHEFKNGFAEVDFKYEKKYINKDGKMFESIP